jgi:DHA2 family multidrug resistance protein
MSATQSEEVMHIDGFRRTLVTICCMIATLMQALDSTIANVALPYMQGSLSASYDQITWVLTSYVIAAAILTAPVGWLAGRFGRKNLFIACLLGFTITSMACGIATSLSEMVIDRLLQGAFGAALVPLSQSTMLDIYPIEQRGSAMAIWGMGVMVGPILGPTLGGYLTSVYNWRYVFFVNLPFGIVAITGLMLLMPKRSVRTATRFDWTGFLVLSLGLAALQIMLDRGEQKDWFSSTTIVVSAVLACLGFYLFIVHMMTGRNTFIPRSIFKDRNFNASLITMFSVGMVLLASSALLAPYLENLGGYPVETAGIIMAPRGAGTMLTMLIAGRLANRIDPRALMLFGYILLAISFVMLESWLPSVSETYMIESLVIQGAALGFIFIPLQMVAFLTVSPELRTQGTSLLSLLRNVGSAIGISITEALLTRQTQVVHSTLSGFITPFNRALQTSPAVRGALNPATPKGAATLAQLIGTQAQIIAYIDDYKFMLLSSIPAVMCLFLMRGPKRAAAPLPRDHSMAIE